MAAPAPAGLVQALFERELGPPLELPRAIAAASSAARTDCRELEKLRFRVARGLSLDYQGVPATGTLVGLTYQPPRPAPRRKPQPLRPAAAASLSSAGSSLAVASSEGDLASAASLAVQRAQRAQQQQQQAAVHPQPAHATLWALVQPAAGVGVHTALSAVNGGPTGFGGWHQAGFLDVSRRAGVDYSLSRHPASGLAADLELSATLPKLPLLPELGARHRVAGAQGCPGVQHATSISAVLPGGAALARVTLQEPAAGPSGSSVVLEVQGRSKRSRGLAGGATLQPALAEAFNGGRQRCTAVQASNGSDSDDEGCEPSAASRRRVPGLRLQLVPTLARSWQDVSGQWQQAWGARLSSSLQYQAAARRWNLQLSSKLPRRLAVTGTLACEGPAAGTALAAGSGVESGGSDGSQLARLRSCVTGYVAASRLCRAALKLRCQLPRPSRQSVQLESSVDGEGSVSHALRWRLGGGAASDFLQQRPRCDLSLAARPHRRELSLRLDLFAPL